MGELAEFCLWWLGPPVGFVVGFCSRQPPCPLGLDEQELPRFRVIPPVSHKPFLLLGKAALVWSCASHQPALYLLRKSVQPHRF